MIPKASIIIPVKELNDFLRKETIPALLKQTFKNFEIIILTDKKSKEKFPKVRIIPTWPKTGPADKRDMGAEKARGEILAFLDDDSYPNKNWLKNALNVFKESDDITGVCGPNLTPPHNNFRKKASGYVWSTWLGSGGAGTYRCQIKPRREVDDFPTVNLLVRKKDFFAVDGFDSHFWPGEDTKLCMDLVYKLKKRIIYDPKVLVFHHRREIFRPHLQQINRYAVHRGHFAKVLPKTSFRIGYFIPTLFALMFFLSPILFFILKKSNLVLLANLLLSIYLAIIFVYFLALLLTCFGIYLKEKSIKLSFLSALSIFVTHISYGLFFIKGFFAKSLQR